MRVNCGVHAECDDGADQPRQNRDSACDDQDLAGQRGVEPHPDYRADDGADYVAERVQGADDEPDGHPDAAAEPVEQQLRLQPHDQPHTGKIPRRGKLRMRCKAERERSGRTVHERLRQRRRSPEISPYRANHSRPSPLRRPPTSSTKRSSSDRPPRTLSTVPDATT